MTEALPRSEGTQEQMTPPRTVAVGLLTLVAVVAVALAFAFAAGNVLIGIGVLPYYPPPTNWPTTTFSLSFHNVGEFLAVGPFAILLLVCLVTVGVGVRGALQSVTDGSVALPSQPAVTRSSHRTSSGR